MGSLPTTALSCVCFISWFPGSPCAVSAQLTAEHEMNELLYDTARLVLGAADVRCRAWVRLMNRFRDRGSVYLARFCSNRLKRYGMYVSSTARIARSVAFPHPTGIVIGAGVEIEENVRIFQSVTLGGARIGDWQAG